jgi:hypothetical protein
MSVPYLQAFAARLPAPTGVTFGSTLPGARAVALSNRSPFECSNSSFVNALILLRAHARVLLLKLSAFA